MSTRASVKNMDNLNDINPGDMVLLNEECKMSSFKRLESNGLSSAVVVVDKIIFNSSMNSKVIVRFHTLDNKITQKATWLCRKCVKCKL